MRDASKLLGTISFALLLTAFGCRAQVPGKDGDHVSPETARRIEVLLRSKSSVPPNYQIQVGALTKSEVPGFHEIAVSFVADGKTSKPILFLLSQDGKTLAQFSRYDISRNPKDLVSLAGRPARGGAANAPVDIVVFNDLECPFCAKMHTQMFPAVPDRYKGQVRIVYRDFPLKEIHPWAMRAAIDTNCMATQSSTGYWNLVDYIHAHAAELGGPEKSLETANAALDRLTTEEGARQKLDAPKLAACVAKQDTTPIDQSMQEAAALGVDATPALFINGEKIEGAQPMEYVFQMIDDALTAEGLTPPPPAKPVAPPVLSTAPLTNQKAPATKPGN